jgi:hypothetical protein
MAEAYLLVQGKDALVGVICRAWCPQRGGNAWMRAHIPQGNKRASCCHVEQPAIPQRLSLKSGGVHATFDVRSGNDSSRRNECSRAVGPSRSALAFARAEPRLPSENRRFGFTDAWRNYRRQFER